jgi:hypothetical protein
MAVTTFSIVQSGDEFYCVSADGTQVEGPLVMPAGVTVDGTIRAQYSILNQKVIITRAVTPSVWVDPETFTVRKLSVAAPVAAPVLAAGSGTGLTGTVYGSYSYVVHINGVVVQESPRSPLSNAVVLANDDIDWSSLVPSSDPAVTGYRLYRTVQDGDPSVLFRAVEITNPAATGYTGDAVPDASLDLLPAPDIGNPPETLGVCIAWRNRLWAVGTEQDEIDDLRATDIDNPFSWPTSLSFPVPVKGEDQWGVTGFLPRRDQLVVCKRARMVKVIGSSADDFEIIILAEGPGSVSPDSCVVINDLGYCHGLQGVYEVGPNGPQDIAEGKIGAWLKTNVEFSRDVSILPLSVATHNPVTRSYELQMARVGSTDIDTWVSFNLAAREWTGPHRTEAFTNTARGTICDAQGQMQSLLGDSAGYLYLMNQAEAYDLAGPAPTTPVGIPTLWRSKPYVGQTPDGFHVWGRVTVHQRAQGSDAAGPHNDVTVYIFAGDIREQGQLLLNPTRVVRLPQTRTRIELPPAGWGQSLQLVFTHNYTINPATGAFASAGASQVDFELWGLELPVAMVGRR